ncbi:hypothetical protein HDZ31DRAFT_42128 [Schizophyllum fasciatum]
MAKNRSSKKAATRGSHSQKETSRSSRLLDAHESQLAPRPTKQNPSSKHRSTGGPHSSRRSSTRRVQPATGPRAPGPGGHTRPPPSSHTVASTAHGEAPAFAVPNIIPNAENLGRAIHHQIATMSGTLAEGEEPARFSSIYKYLPAYLGLQPGQVIPQCTMPTASNGEVGHYLYSEDVAREMIIAEYGDLEEGMEDIKELYQNAEIIGGHPDPADTTVRRIEFPKFPEMKFYMRYWLGHHSALISMDVCDIETDRPIQAPKDFTLFQIIDPPFGGFIQLKSLAHCMHLDNKSAVSTFTVMEGVWIEFRFKGKVVKKVQMPKRPQPAQQALPGIELQDLSSMSLYVLHVLRSV